MGVTVVDKSITNTVGVTQEIIRVQGRLVMRIPRGAVITAKLRAANERHGDLTPAYFAEVRRISLQAWRDLDRRQVFEETYETAGTAEP